MIIYIEESGYNKSWVFVAVKIPSERDARMVIKRWRHYAASVSSSFNANEYRDCKTPDRQREKVLKEISKMGFKFWVLHFFNYRGHKADYSEAVLELLKGVDLSDVVFIMLDKVEQSWRYMARHVEKVRDGLPFECPEMLWGNSEKEKGIQIADAICGAASRKFNNKLSPSYFNIIEHLMVGYKIIRK